VKPLHAVQLAVELAHRRRDAAAKALSGALLQQKAAFEQLDQLQAYARETQIKWTDRAQVSASPTLMYHHYQFMGKLDQAVLFQNNVIHNHENHLERLRQALIEADQRLMSFEHVLKARKAEIAQVQNRQEQRQMDELASRMGAKPRRHHGAEDSVWLSN
jgi:flagellar FliJ protein